MKIGILISHPTQFEGPFFRYMAQHSGQDLRVIYTNGARMESIFDPELGTRYTWGIDLLSGYPYSVLPMQNRVRWLQRHLEQEKYDFLIINGYRPPEYLLAAMMARRNGATVALRLDSVRFSSLAPAKHAAKRTMFLVFSQLYHHFFAIGTLTVKYLESLGIPRERISFFTYPVDTEYFKNKSQLTVKAKRELKYRYGLPEDGKVVLSVTKFNAREAPWDLLEAFSSLPERGDASLLLVGEGPQRTELEAYSKSHPERRISFAGYVPYTELPRVYGIADIFVHPVRNEPWGVSVVEAQACGLPVIASSEVGSAYDHIRPGVNGDMYQAGNPNDLRNKLENLLARSNVSQVQSDNERILAEWNYSSTLHSIVETGTRYAEVLPEN